MDQQDNFLKGWPL